MRKLGGRSRTRCRRWSSRWGLGSGNRRIPRSAGGRPGRDQARPLRGGDHLDAASSRFPLVTARSAPQGRRAWATRDSRRGRSESRRRCCGVAARRHALVTPHGESTRRASPAATAGFKARSGCSASVSESHLAQRIPTACRTVERRLRRTESDRPAVPARPLLLQDRQCGRQSRRTPRQGLQPPPKRGERPGAGEHSIAPGLAGRLFSSDAMGEYGQHDGGGERDHQCPQDEGGMGVAGDQRPGTEGPGGAAAIQVQRAAKG